MTAPALPVMFRAGGQPGQASHSIVLDLHGSQAMTMAAATADTLAISAATAGQVVYLADVSEFQPNVVDAVYARWSKAIVIRAMYGSAHIDHAWYSGARRAALHSYGMQFIGIYQYVTAFQDAKAQAQALAKLLGHLENGETVIADIEEGSGGQHDRWMTWKQTIAAELGWHDPMDYSGANFAAAHGLAPVDWVASYGGPEPPVPHTLWQFTDALAVPGVGTCDCSVHYGPISDLVARTYGAAKTGGTTMKVTTPPPGDYKDGVGGVFIGLGPQGQVLYTTATTDGTTWTPPAKP